VSTSRRLEEIPGIGPIVAAALVAEIGDWKAFRSGRGLAAWIGLVPKQHTTGGKNKLGSITKQGNRYHCYLRLAFLPAFFFLFLNAFGIVFAFFIDFLAFFTDFFAAFVAAFFFGAFAAVRDEVPVRVFERRRDVR
jgi:hypothetical protein